MSKQSLIYIPQLSAAGHKKWLLCSQIGGKKGRAFEFNLFFETFHTYYILHNYAIPQTRAAYYPHWSLWTIPNWTSSRDYFSTGLLWSKPFCLNKSTSHLVYVNNASIQFSILHTNTHTQSLLIIRFGVCRRRQRLVPKHRWDLSSTGKKKIPQRALIHDRIVSWRKGNRINASFGV